MEEPSCIAAFKAANVENMKRAVTYSPAHNTVVRLASLAYGRNPLILMPCILKIYSTALAFVDRIIHFKNEVL